MKQIFDQFLQFLQQGVAAIFRFVHLVWAWSIDQISKMMQAPWGTWPLWKQILLIVVIAAVAYVLLIVARRLWYAGVHVLTAFASFIVALVVTLPAMLAAGVIALAGLWVINNLNPSSLPTLTVFEHGNPESSRNGNGNPSGQTTGSSQRETTGSGQ